nr:zinc finger, CCHC-type [Tanacetum cinerariifolium]
MKRRLFKVRVESFAKENLDKEDPSKQGRIMIKEIDQDARVTLVQIDVEDQRRFVDETDFDAGFYKVQVTPTQMQQEKMFRLILEEEGQLVLVVVELVLLVGCLVLLKNQLVLLVHQCQERYFASQKAKEKRNKPMTQAQKRTCMSNYIKNMGSYTLNQLKKISFDEIKELFETTIKRVNTFVPMETKVRGRASELAARSSQAISTNAAKVRFSKRAAEAELDYEVPHHGLDLWLQIRIFYDHVDDTTQKSIDYTTGERLKKLRSDEVWAAIKRLAQYEDEGWNDAFIPDEDAISLMGKSNSVFRLTTKEMYRPPSEPSRQEEFKHIVMNFIFDQEERIRQLEDYMQVITKEFMKFSLEFARRLKNMIKENNNKPRKIEKIKKYPDTKVLENNAKHNFLEILEKKMFPTPAETANSAHLNHLFWPNSGDDGFNVGNAKAKSIMDLRIKLAHRCITMTITGRKETTNRVTEIDLFYLYCIYREVEDEGDDEEGNKEGVNEGVGGSMDIYRDMSVGNWDTCLPATHTAPALHMMALLDHFCFVPLLLSSLVI